MSTETGPDRPPQRTVAELLAAHGEGQPTSGRRRSRHDSADAGGEPSEQRPPEGWAGPSQVERSQPQAPQRRSWSPPAAANGPGVVAPTGAAPQPESWSPRGRREAPEGSAGWRRPEAQSVPDPRAPAQRQPDAGWGPPPPDGRWAAAPAAEPNGREPRLRSSAPPVQQPDRPSRRQLREAREAGLGQLDEQVQGAAAAPQYAGPQQAQSFVENPTDELPRLADPTRTNGSAGSNGATGYQDTTAPMVDSRRTARPRRSRAAHDAGPATGAMSPEELLADDDDEAADDVKILGQNLTDLEAKTEVTEVSPDSDPGAKPADGRSSGRSSRHTPKRGFRLGGRGKAGNETGDGAASESGNQADNEATVLAAAQPPTAGVDPEIATTALKARAGTPRRAVASHGLPEDVPAGLQDRAEAEPAAAARLSRAAADKPAANPIKAWLVIIAQLVGGAVAGAALWVAFRYLWGKLPPVALGAAVLATAGSVLVVRAIRRSDDLRTSLFAVLVGLVVTVSPAVLVLVSR